MKKKLVTGALLAAFGAVAITGGTLAYFTDTDNATNTFTVGNVDITLTEPNWVGSGSQDAPEVYPGEPLAKDPTVTNVGANPCFVRVKVEGLDCLGDAGMITYRTNYRDGELGTGWVEYNGYFYYDKILPIEDQTNPDANKTTPLFTQIAMPTGLENGDAETEFNVVVTAEAVQAQGAKASWAQVQTMTVAEIATWFDTCIPPITPVDPDEPVEGE